MSGIRLLECAIQPYAWGSHTSIARIQGRPVPSPGPEAELWIGDHPNAPCRVRVRPDRAESIELRSFLAQHPKWLGTGPAADVVAPHLPFLLKILAADAPLSLQVHPSAARARQAFSEGHSAYVDDQPKPEILCALTAFRAMVGFRPFDESVELVQGLRSQLPTGSHAESALSDYTSDPGQRSLRNLLAALHRLSPDAVHDLTSALRRLDLRRNRGASPESLAVEELLAHYPDDPLCMAPLLLHVVTLEPGEAIHTEAGILHSYLGGTGVELMNTSDNVLRAGLTEKTIHIDELLDVTHFEPTPPGHSPRTRSDGDPFERFVTPSPTFELGILDWDAERAHGMSGRSAVQILLCTSGHFQIQGPSEQVLLSSGEALLVGANWGPSTLRGRGQLFRATVPAPLS